MASTNSKKKTSTKKKTTGRKKRSDPIAKERVFYDEVTSAISIIDTSIHSPDGIEAIVNTQLADGWSLNSASYELPGRIILYRYKLVRSRTERDPATDEHAVVVINTERPDSWG